MSGLVHAPAVIEVAAVGRQEHAASMRVATLRITITTLLYLWNRC